MASPAQVVRQWLVNQGLVVAALDNQIPYDQLPGDGSTVCFVGSMPDDYDQAVEIHNTGGMMFGRRMADGKQFIHPVVNLLIRTLDESGYDLVNAIAVGLDSFTRSTIMMDEAAYYVQSIYRTSAIIPLGEELGKKRQQWSINARVAFQDQQPSLG